jgi:hypothetical protein
LTLTTSGSLSQASFFIGYTGYRARYGPAPTGAVAI